MLKQAATVGSLRGILGMVLELDRENTESMPVTSGGGGMARTERKMHIADGDDPRDLLYHLSVAFDEAVRKRDGVTLRGDSRIGTLYNDDVLIDIQRTPASITPEGVAPPRTNIMVISSLGWLSLDDDGIREPHPEYEDLGTPTLQEARLIAYDALQKVLVNPPQQSALSNAA